MSKMQNLQKYIDYFKKNSTKKLEFYKLTILKRNSINLDNIKNWAIKNNEHQTYDFFKQAVDDLYNDGYLDKKDSSLFEFIENKKSELLSEIVDSNDFLSSMYNDVAVKAKLHLSNFEVGVNSSNSSSYIVNYIEQVAMSIDKFTFKNSAIAFSQAVETDKQVADLLSLREIENTMLNNAKLTVKDEEKLNYVEMVKSVKINTPKTGDKTIYKIENYYTLEQTNAKDINYSKEKIFNKEKLLLYIANTINNKIKFRNNFIEDKQDIKEIIEFYFDEKTNEYFKDNVNEGKLFQYSMQKSLGMNVLPDESINYDSISIASLQKIYNSVKKESAVLDREASQLYATTLNTKRLTPREVQDIAKQREQSILKKDIYGLLDSYSNDFVALEQNTLEYNTIRELAQVFKLSSIEIKNDFAMQVYGVNDYQEVRLLVIAEMVTEADVKEKYKDFYLSKIIDELYELDFSGNLTQYQKIVVNAIEDNAYKFLQEKNGKIEQDKLMVELEASLNANNFKEFEELKEKVTDVKSVNQLEIQKIIKQNSLIEQERITQEIQKDIEYDDRAYKIETRAFIGKNIKGFDVFEDEFREKTTLTFDNREKTVYANTNDIRDLYRDEQFDYLSVEEVATLSEDKKLFDEISYDSKKLLVDSVFKKQSKPLYEDTIKVISKTDTMEIESKKFLDATIRAITAHEIVKGGTDFSVKLEYILDEDSNREVYGLDYINDEDILRVVNDGLIRKNLKVGYFDGVELKLKQTNNEFKGNLIHPPEYTSDITKFIQSGAMAKMLDDNFKYETVLEKQNISQHYNSLNDEQKLAEQDLLDSVFQERVHLVFENLKQFTDEDTIKENATFEQVGGGSNVVGVEFYGIKDDLSLDLDDYVNHVLLKYVTDNEITQTQKNELLKDLNFTIFCKELLERKTNGDADVADIDTNFITENIVTEIKDNSSKQELSLENLKELLPQISDSEKLENINLIEAEFIKRKMEISTQLKQEVTLSFTQSVANIKPLKLYQEEYNSHRVVGYNYFGVDDNLEDVDTLVTKIKQNSQYKEYYKENNIAENIVEDSIAKNMMMDAQYQIIKKDKHFQEIKKQIATVPKLYSTEDEKEPIVRLHYFRGGSDWFITELDTKENLAFGYVILNNDIEMAELGYISLEELKNADVEMDFYFTQRPLSEIKDEHSKKYYANDIETQELVLEEEILVNHVIENNRDFGGAKTRFKANIEAIQTLSLLDGKSATSKEKETISKYVGWGGLPQAFYKHDGSASKGWEKETAQLEVVLSDEQYKQARRSTLDSFYTNEEIAKSIWEVAQKLGFKGGNVLEPSVGVGNFIGYMPQELKDSVKIDAVEIDKLSSDITKALYPKAKVYNLGFEKFEADKKYSLIIGNPPYGSHQIDGLSIHNYFMKKSIDSLEEGGVLAVVITNNFLDAKDITTKEYISETSNLELAYRLPNDSFIDTQVTTDILIFRKRREGEEAQLSWLQNDNVNDIEINSYFSMNQENLLGDWGLHGTMYGGNEPALVKRADENIKLLLDEKISKLTSEYRFNDVVIEADVFEKKTLDIDIPYGVRVGEYFVKDDNLFYRKMDINNEKRAEQETTKFDSKDIEKPLTELELKKMKAMVNISTIFRDLRNFQIADNVADNKLENARDELNIAYDKFVKDYGFLSKSSNKKLFEKDMNAPLLRALEKDYDEGISKAIAQKSGLDFKKPTATKADIFTKRTQFPTEEITQAKDIEHAIALSLNKKALIDTKLISELLSSTEEIVIKEMQSKNLIFEENNKWIYKDEYLSGNVKGKYKDTDNPINKRALKSVFPKDIEAIDIEVNIGAMWLPESDMTDFAKFITGDKNAKITKFNHSSSWAIKATPTYTKNDEYGTNYRKAHKIINSAMNSQAVKITYKDEDGKTHVNIEATLEANDKVQLVKDTFKNWIFDDSERRSRLEKLYNEEMNIYCKRVYDGSHLELSGQVSDEIFECRVHQKNAVWRAIQDTNVLLDHNTGSGKTATAITAIMELRRLGKANKPMLGVPNHLVEQWGKEFLELYPNANVLIPTKQDFSKDKRREFIARATTGNYDAIIVAHSQLKLIKNSPETERNVIDEEIENIRETISMLEDENDDSSHFSVKGFEKRIMKLEEKYEKFINKYNSEEALNFAEIGVDCLVIDEFHGYKNLAFSSSMQNVAGLGNQQGSDMATDMLIKLRTLKEQNEDANAIVLTATPISNQLSELYAVSRYLNPERLKELNLNSFDSWARQYTEAKTDWKLGVTGQYKQKTRLASFVNVPELLAEYQLYADTVNKQDIDDMLRKLGKELPVPKLENGIENIVVERSEAVANFIGIKDENGHYAKGSLSYRGENLPKGKPKKGDDNILVIMSDASKASLDYRLINPNADDFENSKVNTVVRNTFDIYQKYDELKGTQLIFCDLSTPKIILKAQKEKFYKLLEEADEGSEKAIKILGNYSDEKLALLESNSSYSVYDDIKEKLISKGMLENQIAFVHEANTDKRKLKLSSDINNGIIRVLIGSTAKMGTGSNYQKRLTALHNIDVPYRPDQLAQRNGRIERQGNILFNNDPENFRIRILNYATENTLDAKKWEILETKSKFIEQLKKNNIDSRVVEELSTSSFNMEEMKALCSGNPLILEEMQIKKEIGVIEKQQHIFNKAKYQRDDKIKSIARSIQAWESGEKDLLEDIKLFDSIDKAEVFITKDDGVVLSKRQEIGEYLIACSAQNFSNREERVIGKLFDKFEISLTRTDSFSFSDDFIITATGNESYDIPFNSGKQGGGGLLIKLLNRLDRLSGDFEYSKETNKDNKVTLHELKEFNIKQQEFPFNEKLTSLKERNSEINKILRSTAKKVEIVDKNIKEVLTISKEEIDSLDSSDLNLEIQKLQNLQKSSDVVNVKSAENVGNFEEAELEVVSKNKRLTPK